MRFKKRMRASDAGMPRKGAPSAQHQAPAGHAGADLAAAAPWLPIPRGPPAAPPASARIDSLVLTRRQLYGSKPTQAPPRGAGGLLSAAGLPTPGTCGGAGACCSMEQGAPQQQGAPKGQVKWICAPGARQHAR